jgi:hypothetical protein
MAHRDFRKRRGGRTLKQGPEFRMQALAARCRENAELKESSHYWGSYVASAACRCFGTSGTWRIKFADCTWHLRRMRHLRDRGEIAVRANSTIKYAFILWSDLPEFACRADRHHMLARYQRSRTADASSPVDRQVNAIGAAPSRWAADVTRLPNGLAHHS